MTVDSLIGGEAACLTIVSEQRLRRTLTVWASGVCAPSAVIADAAVGATVTLTSQCGMASIDAALKTGSTAIVIFGLGVANLTDQSMQRRRVS